MEEKRYFRYTFILITLTTLIRIYLASTIGLGVDEAHYVQYALHPSLSYYDHPPLVGYLIRFFIIAIGKSLLSVRMPAIISGIGTAFLLFLIGKRLYGPSAGFWAVVIFNCIPLFSAIGGITIVPDTLLCFFWVLLVFLIWEIYRTERGELWYPVGIITGLSLLTKYTGFILFPSILIFVISIPSMRKWMKKRETYIAFFISVVLFLPVVIWNYENHWVSFIFQFSHGLGEKEFFNGERFLRNIGAQAGVFSPFIFFLLVYTLIWAVKQAIRKDDKAILILSFSLPVIFLFAYSGLSNEVLPHWPATGYLTLLPLMGAIATLSFKGQVKRRMKILFLSSLIIGGLLTVIIPVQLIFHPFPLSQDIDISSDITGWGQLAERIREIKINEKEKDFFVFTHKFYIASQLAYYLEPEIPVYCLSKRIDQYDFWQESENLKKSLYGRNGLFFCDDHFNVNPEKMYVFKKIEEKEILPAGYSGRNIKNFYIYRCLNFDTEKTDPNLLQSFSFTHRSFKEAFKRWNENTFLFINSYACKNRVLDIFFLSFTWLGSNLVLVPVVLLLIFLRHRNLENSDDASSSLKANYKVFEKKKLKMFTPTLSLPPQRGRMKAGRKGFRGRILLTILNKQKGGRYISVFILALIISGTIGYILKETVAAPRPLAYFGKDTVNILGPPLKRGSFPSGHSLTVFTGVLALSRAIPSYGLIFWLFGILSGISRCYVGAHFPVDVIGGFLIAVFSFYISLWLTPKIDMRQLFKKRYIALTLLFLLFLLLPQSSKHPIYRDTYEVAENIKVIKPLAVRFFTPFTDFPLYFINLSSPERQLLYWFIWLSAIWLVLVILKHKKIKEFIRGIFIILIVLLLTVIYGIFLPVQRYKLIPKGSDDILIDLHSHTIYSHDGIATPAYNLQWHKNYGFNCWAVTEHDYTGPAKILQEAMIRQNNIPSVCIPGQEIKFKGIYLNILGIEKTINPKEFNDLSELIKRVHSQGGAVIAPHIWAEKRATQSLEELALAGIDGLEIAGNSSVPLTQEKQKELIEFCKRNGIVMVSGTNWHGWNNLCNVWTSFRIEGWKEMEPEEIEDAVINGLRNRDIDRFRVITYQYNYAPKNPIFEPLKILYFYITSIDRLQRFFFIFWLTILYIIFHSVKDRRKLTGMVWLAIALLLFLKGVYFLEEWHRVRIVNEILPDVSKGLFTMAAITLILSLTPLKRKR